MSFPKLDYSWSWNLKITRSDTDDGDVTVMDANFLSEEDAINCLNDFKERNPSFELEDEEWTITNIDRSVGENSLRAWVESLKDFADCKYDENDVRFMLFAENVGISSYNKRDHLWLKYINNQLKEELSRVAEGDLNEFSKIKG